MDKELEEAKKTINKLECQLREKETIIAALIHRINGCHTQVPDVSSDEIDPMEKSKHAAVGDVLLKENDGASKDHMEVEMNYKDKLDEINEVLITKRKKQVTPLFKPNMDIDDFASFCSKNNISLILEQRKELRFNKTIKLYIKNNMKGILKYVFDRINDAKIYDTYSIFYCIQGELSYSVKVIILHDLFLFCADPSVILMLAFTIFQSSTFQNDLLSVCIKRLLGYQYLIEKDIYKEHPDIVKALDIIKDRMKFDSEYFDIREYCETLVVDEPIFSCGEVNEELVARGSAIKLLCNFVDWDWTYNSFIVEFLMGKLLSEEKPSYLYYIGVLTLNGMRLFGLHGSVKVLIGEIEKYLNSNAITLGIVSYLFIKQIKPLMADRWMESRLDEVKEDININAQYLRTYIPL
jgi:hypothetical protein